MYSSLRVCALGRMSRSTSPRMSFSGALRLGLQLPRAQRAHQHALDLVAAEAGVRVERGRSASASGNFSFFAIALNSARHLVRRLRREERDVHVEPALPLEIDFEQVRARRREHPQDAPAVARVGHLLGEHRVDAARQPAVAVAALALAGSLVGLVDEHDDLADRLEHREDLLEVRLGRADPPIAEVLEDDARDAELARPALHQEGLAGADPARRSRYPIGSACSAPLRSSAASSRSHAFTGSLPGEVIERERRLDEVEQTLALRLDQVLLHLRDPVGREALAAA